MASSYRGFTVMDPLDPPDVPKDMRVYTDTGPIPRFPSLAALQAAMNPASAGMIAAVGQQIYRYIGHVWVAMDPKVVYAASSGNIGTAPSNNYEIAKVNLNIAGLWFCVATIMFDSAATATQWNTYFQAGPGGSHLSYLEQHNSNLAGSHTFAANVNVIPGAPIDVVLWVAHWGGGASTFRGDISCRLISPA